MDGPRPRRGGALRDGRNANAPPDVLAKLAADPKFLVVRRTAAKHPALPLAVLSHLARSDPEASVRASAATNPNVTEDLLELLATDEDPYTVGNVACSPLATDALRARLRTAPERVGALGGRSLPRRDRRGP